jgi:hypothetical protein
MNFGSGEDKNTINRVKLSIPNLIYQVFITRSLQIHLPVVQAASFMQTVIIEPGTRQ